MNVSLVFASVSRKAGGLFGAGRRLAQELQLLPETRVSVVGLADEFSEVDALEWAPARVFTGKTRGPRALGWSPGYRAALRSERPDLVHQHGIWTLGSLETSRYAQRNRAPLVVSLHGMMDPWALRNSQLKKRLAWIAYQRQNLEQAGALLVTSLREAEALRGMNVHTPIALIPNGVDPIEADGLPPWSDRLPSERRVILFLGRIHPKKGISELLRGFAAFRRHSPDRAEAWSLVITGWDDGGHEASLRALGAELGLTEPSLLWTGPLFGKERDAALVHASGFILPSFSEGMPLAALEALEAGTPVLLTPECNLPIVFERSAGLRIEANEESIAQGIAELTALSEAERSGLSARGRALAAEAFSWSQIARDTRRIYAWLLGQGEKPNELFP